MAKKRTLGALSSSAIDGPVETGRNIPLLWLVAR